MVNMNEFFKDVASKGQNPFNLVTHIDGKRRKVAKKMKKKNDPLKEKEIK